MGIVKTRQVDVEIQIFFLISVSVNDRITTANVIYITSTTKTSIVNGGIMTVIKNLYHKHN